MTNPPREQPLNEDDCVYVFMSLRQPRTPRRQTAGSPFSIICGRARRPARRAAAGCGADHAAVAAATTLRRVTQLERLLEHFSVSDAPPPPAATADADAGEGESSGASPGSLLSENAMLREALAVERRRNAQLATFLERALEKSGEEPATPTTPAGEF